MQTTTKEETYTRSMRITLGVRAQGGSVALQLRMGTDNWITTDTLVSDGAYPIDVPPATLRIVPSGGAAFEVYA